jgi:hypothetical protein
VAYDACDRFAGDAARGEPLDLAGREVRDLLRIGGR